MENRPKIKIRKEPLDWVVEIVGFSVILTSAWYVFSQYGNLPEKIPRHFAMGGNVDAYGDKSTIIVLLVAAIVMFAGMYILNRFPHVFNYPEDMRPEEAPALYKNSSKLIRITNTVMTLGLGYIIFSTIQTATKNMNGLSNYFMPVFLLALFGPIIYYIVKSFKIRKAFKQQ